MNIGKNLLNFRTKTGLTQLALAKKIGVSKTTVFRWETNLSKPSLEAMIKMAKSLKVSLDSILLSENDRNKLKSSNTALAKRLKSIEKLSYKDQKTLFQIIDTFVNSK